MTGTAPEASGEHVTVRKADLDILVAACTSYLPPDASPGVARSFGRLLGPWEAAGGDGPRCDDCGMLLSGHHDPSCSQPCGACEAAKAPDYQARAEAADAVLAELDAITSGPVLAGELRRISAILSAWRETR